MYLSIQRCFKLDKIVKSFEVALRTYVSNKIINTYDDNEKFKFELERIREESNNLNIINSGYNIAKLEMTIKNNKDIYEGLLYSQRCRLNKDYDNKQVLYVGQLFDLILIFFNPLFIELGRKFETNNEFLFSSNKYSKLRNDLSHPASSKIKKEDSIIILKYIEKLQELLGYEDYWYISKNEIIKDISEYKKEADSEIFKIHNLNELEINYKRLISRENELSMLSDYIIGKDKYYRKSGSVVLYGYGGVGKTAIVTEFINRIAKKKNDGDKSFDIDFILYFTSKDEKLDFSKTTGDLFISQQKRQVNNFGDFMGKFFKYINIKDIEEYKCSMLRGIVVIDNIETFSEVDKNKMISEFIKLSPIGIQFIITSRNEEKCDESIHVEGFSAVSEGMKFIDEYIDEYDLFISLSIEEKEKLILASNGNTLILILSLTRLNSGKASIDQVLFELNNIAAQNTEIIANFMYKNTFDNIIRELEAKEYNPVEVLLVISYYNEPVDLLTINLLCNCKNIRNVEYICKELSSRLVLNKYKEQYELNEFAAKFVFIKMKPNNIELKKLKDLIRDRKRFIKENLDTLNEKRSKLTYLNDIINEWKPRTYIDKLAVAEVYNLYSEAKKITSLDSANQNYMIEKLNKKFVDYELSTSHPYIRYQKARCYQLLLQYDINISESRDIANNYFELAIMSIEYDYTFIQETSSYAHILWLFGQFKLKYLKDPKSALKYYQQAQFEFEELGIIDETYYKVLANSCDALFDINAQGDQREYIKLHSELLKLLNENSHKYKSIQKYLNYHAYRARTFLDKD